MTEPLPQDPVLARLDLIERRLERLVGVLEQAPAAVAMAADAADEWAASHVDTDERVNAALALVDKLSEPGTLEALHRVVELLPHLKPVAELAATFEDTTGMVFDIFDAQMASLASQGINPEQRVAQVLELMTGLTDPDFSAHLKDLLQAAPGLISATRTGEMFGRAVDEASSQGESPPIGFFGLVRALGEPEVQRAAGFAVQVARRVGARLPDHIAHSTALTRT